MLQKTLQSDIGLIIYLIYAAVMTGLNFSNNEENIIIEGDNRVNGGMAQLTNHVAVNTTKK